MFRLGGKAGHSSEENRVKDRARMKLLTSPMTTAELGVHHMSFCSPASPSQHPNPSCCYVVLLLASLAHLLVQLGHECAAAGPFRLILHGQRGDT